MKTGKNEESDRSREGMEPLLYGPMADAGPAHSRREFVLGTAAIGLAAATGATAYGGNRGQQKNAGSTELVVSGQYGRYDVLGPLLEFFTPAENCPDYAAMLGTLPPRTMVPLHSHPDDESFFLISGSMLR